jgi:hypothetical protein
MPDPQSEYSGLISILIFMDVRIPVDDTPSPLEADIDMVKTRNITLMHLIVFEQFIISSFSQQ